MAAFHHSKAASRRLHARDPRHSAVQFDQDQVVQDQVAVQNIFFGSELHGFQFFCLILVPCAVLATAVLASVLVYLVAVLVRTLPRYCGIAPPLSSMENTMKVTTNHAALPSGECSLGNFTTKPFVER